MSDDVDEVALNVLLAEGIDPATAYVASQRDNAPPSKAGQFVAIIVGLILVVLAVAFLAVWRLN